MTAIDFNKGKAQHCKGKTCRALPRPTHRVSYLLPWRRLALLANHRSFVMAGAIDSGVAMLEYRSTTLPLPSTRNFSCAVSEGEPTVLIAQNDRRRAGAIHTAAQ